VLLQAFGRFVAGKLAIAAAIERQRSGDQCIESAHCVTAGFSGSCLGRLSRPFRARSITTLRWRRTWCPELAQFVQRHGAVPIAIELAERRGCAVDFRRIERAVVVGVEQAE
jgi:hypothetical protein